MQEFDVFWKECWQKELLTRVLNDKYLPDLENWRRPDNWIVNFENTSVTYLRIWKTLIIAFSR